MTQEDRQLFERARGGDHQAFWRLVLPYRGLIYSVAYGILRNHERAEDTLHEVLLSAFRSLGNLREPGRLGSWLNSVTRNHVLDVLRREQRRRGALPAIQATASAAVIPVTELAENESQLQRMEEALGRLPEPFRIILAMKYMNDYSCRQIAEILDISETAVKSRLFEARKLLRRVTESVAVAEGEETRHELR